MQVWVRASVLPLLSLAIACGQPADSSGPSFATVNGAGDRVVNYEEFELCKSGSSASFTYSVTDVASGNVTSGQASLTDGECVVLALVGGRGANLSVTETSAQSGYQFDHATVAALSGAGCTYPGSVTTTTTTNATVTGHISGGTGDGVCDGLLVTYSNVTIPSVGQGCTPGYWKQSQHFDSWPAAYPPNLQFSAVFEDAFPGKTLLQVLGQGGGGLIALGRHVVAALLNAGSNGVNYGVTTGDIINAFNAVFPGGDYETLKNRYAIFNERGCPLN